VQWKRASEIVAGHVILGNLTIDSVNPATLETPYDSAVRLLSKGAKEIDLADGVGIHALTVAKDAARNATGDPRAYLEIVEEAALRVGAGRKLRPLVDKLERGEGIDVARAISALGHLENGYRQFTPASEIEPEAQIYVPSYYAPLDDYVGGYPQAGLSIVAGITGTGKTTFLIEMARSSARAGQRCAILTLEMTNGQLLYRMLQVDKKLTKKQRKNILLSDDVYSIDEAYSAIAQLAAKEELHFIGIDYADMLVGQAEQSEASMGRIYNTLAVLAKKIHIPIVLVAQYRRTDGVIPTIQDIRYSGRAEQAASMILLLYNKGVVFAKTSFEKKGPLPHIPNTAWILVGKTRYMGNQPTALGAINVEWNGEGGWGPANGRDPWHDLTNSWYDMDDEDDKRPYRYKTRS
jgi:hypothetical protein